VFVLAACAVLAGAQAFVAIAEWAADIDPTTLFEIGVIRRAQSESTFRRYVCQLTQPQTAWFLSGRDTSTTPLLSSATR
jgi:hypothetical protein